MRGILALWALLLIATGCAPQRKLGHAWAIPAAKVETAETFPFTWEVVSTDLDSSTINFRMRAVRKDGSATHGHGMLLLNSGGRLVAQCAIVGFEVGRGLEFSCRLDRELAKESEFIFMLVEQRQAPDTLSLPPERVYRFELGHYVVRQ